MGYQDREYYHEEQAPSGMQLGGELSYTWRLVIVTVAVWLVNFFAFPQLMGDWLAVRGDTVVRPQFWYQFLTYGFAHNPEGLGHIFWNMFGLVIFGSQIERTYGKREYLRFYLVSILVCGLFWGLRVYLQPLLGIEFSKPGLQLSNITLVGASGAVMAVTILFCLRYPFATIHVMMLFPVPAWVVGVVYVVGNLVSASAAVAGEHTVAYDVHLVGALFALAYFALDLRLTPYTSFAWMERAGNSIKTLFRPRPKLKVYDEAEPDDSLHRRLEAEADRILEKIATQGESSLSKEERQTLERYSRLMRQKHR
jgi:membrane associated rhomboid family serine protease